MADERRLDDALDALSEVEPVRRWDDVVGRAQQPDDGVREVQIAGWRGRVPRWALAAAAAVVVIGLAAGAAAWQRTGDDNGEPLQVGNAPDGQPPATGTTTEEVAIIPTHCGEVALDDVGWFAYTRSDVGFTFVDRATSLPVDIELPGEPVRDLVGEQTRSVQIVHGEATLWFRTNRTVQLRFEPPIDIPRCPVVSVTVEAGTDEDAAVSSAVRWANALHFLTPAEAEARLRADEAAERPSQLPGFPSRDGTCAQSVLTSSTLPAGFSASLAADGAFEGDGQSISVERIAPTGAADIAVPSIPWLFATTTVNDRPAIEVQVSDSCALRLVAHGGVTHDQLQALLTTAYLIVGDRRPRLTDHCALWPETSLEQVAVGAPSDRDAAEDVAVAFAEHVLRWDRAVAVGDEAVDWQTTTVTVEQDEHRISVRLVRCLGGRWWSVADVDPAGREGDEFGASVSVQGSMASASATPPPGAAQGLVRFDYGGRVVEAPADDQPVDLGFVPDTAGSVVVSFVDSSGEVVGAWGTTLPAGDFAAG